MLRPRTLREIIDIEMRDALLSKMQAEKSLEYATSVVDYNRQRIRRLQEKLLEIGDKDAWNNRVDSVTNVPWWSGGSDGCRGNFYVE